MGRSLGYTFVGGDPWVQCDRCGFTVRKSDTRKEWNGLQVCTKDFEYRQPQDYVRSKPDKQSFEGARPPQDSFVTQAYPNTPTLDTPTGGTNQIVLTWTAISGATGYKLYYSPNDSIDGKSNEIDTGDVVTYTQTGLNSNERVFYRLSSYDADATSPMSLTVSGRAN